MEGAGFLRLIERFKNNNIVKNDDGSYSYSEKSKQVKAISRHTYKSMTNREIISYLGRQRILR